MKPRYLLLKYFAIGRGGHRMILDKEDVAVPDVVEHETTTQVHIDRFRLFYVNLMMIYL